MVKKPNATPKKNFSFSSAKAIAAIKGVLILLAGIIGAKALKGIVESKFPQYAQYTNIGVLAAALAGTMVAKPIVQNVAKGGLVFAAVQILNQYAPDAATKFIPQISGLGDVSALPDVQELQYYQSQEATIDYASFV